MCGGGGGSGIKRKNRAVEIAPSRRVGEGHSSKWSRRDILASKRTRKIGKCAKLKTEINWENAKNSNVRQACENGEMSKSGKTRAVEIAQNRGVAKADFFLPNNLGVDTDPRIED